MFPQLCLNARLPFFAVYQFFDLCVCGFQLFSQLCLNARLFFCIVFQFFVSCVCRVEFFPQFGVFEGGITGLGRQGRFAERQFVESLIERLLPIHQRIAEPRKTIELTQRKLVDRRALAAQFGQHGANGVRAFQRRYFR